jgi:hypothetical protein
VRSRHFFNNHHMRISQVAGFSVLFLWISCSKLLLFRMLVCDRTARHSHDLSVHWAVTVQFPAETTDFLLSLLVPYLFHAHLPIHWVAGALFPKAVVTREWNCLARKISSFLSPIKDYFYRLKTMSMCSILENMGSCSWNNQLLLRTRVNEHRCDIQLD